MENVIVYRNNDTLQHQRIHQQTVLDFNNQVNLQNHLQAIGMM